METDDAPLDVSEIQWNPKTEISIPPDLIEAVAMGLEEPEVIAQRFGITGERWQKLKTWEPFVTTVAGKRAEYAKNGVTFRMKSALKADMLADRVFVEAMQPTTGMAQKMAVLNYLTRVGDLEPKESKTATGGEGFSITINLGDRKTVEKTTPPTVLEAEIVENSLEQLVDPQFLDELRQNSQEDD